MTTTRHLGYLGYLAGAQLRRHVARWTLLAAGVALVVALPIGSAAVSGSARDQTIRRTVKGLGLAPHYKF